MSYAELAESVGNLTETNTKLTEAVLSAQVGMDGARDETFTAKEQAVIAAQAAETFAEMAQTNSQVFKTVEEGLATGTPFFAVLSPENTEVYRTYENVDGVAVDTGKITPSVQYIEKIAARSLFTHYTNSLYLTGFEGSKFTGVVPSPAFVKASVVKSVPWAEVGIKNALRFDVLASWNELATKVVYDANVIADKQATISLSPDVVADFHAGDTVNFRMLYRSNKAATFAIIIIKSDGFYDSIAGGTPGRINLPSTDGVVTEFQFSVVANSVNPLQALLCPRIYGQDNQAFAVGDYFEHSEMVMQKLPVKPGTNYKHPTKDDFLQQTTELAEKTAAKSKFVHYTNRMFATSFDGDHVTGAAPNPTRATAKLITNDVWSQIGVKRALRIDVIETWDVTATKAMYDANVLADRMGSISLDPAAATDFHAGDAINFRMKYRSNTPVTCALIVFKSDGSYDSTVGGAANARVLPSTNGAIAEVRFTATSASVNPLQGFVSPRIYGTDNQKYAVGDFFEYTDMVMQKLVIAEGIDYRHPTRDALLSYNTAPAGKNLFDKTKVVPGRQVSGTGAVVNSATSTLSPYVSVAGVRSLAISGLQDNPGYERFFAFYARDKTTVISAGTSIPAGENSAVIGVPSGAYWFLMTVKRVSVAPDDNSKLQMESGRFATAYTAYMEGVNGIDSIPFVPDALPTPKSSANMSFIGFGDSITTTGTWTDAGVFTDLRTRPWTKIVRDMLPMGLLTNYARSGAAYRDRPFPIIESNWQKISHQVTKAIEFNTPGDVVFVACGTNDGVLDMGDYTTAMSKTTLESLDRTKLYEALRWAYWSISKNWPKAVYFTVTPIQRADATPESLEPLYTAIKRMAARYNFIVIDATAESGIIMDFEVPNKPGRWLKDGLHPSDEGHVKYAETPMRTFDMSLNWG